MELSEISCLTAASIGWRLSIPKRCFSMVSTFVIILTIFDLEIIALFLLCASFDHAVLPTLQFLVLQSNQHNAREMVEDT